MSELYNPADAVDTYTFNRRELHTKDCTTWCVYVYSFGWRVCAENMLQLRQETPEETKSKGLAQEPGFELTTFLITVVLNQGTFKKQTQWGTFINLNVLLIRLVFQLPVLKEKK